MKAIITGDIINSRVVDPKLWMDKLKKMLNTVGKEPNDWEIYRGDSFQLKSTPQQALLTAILLKATIKQFKDLDIRMAIGFGDIEYEGVKITESNGSAFINSGECFEDLKKETMAIRSPWIHFDHTLNTMLSLATITIDNWTPISSRIILEMLSFPELNQKELAKKLQKKSQGTISEGLKRGGFEEIQKLLSYYQTEIKKRC